MRRELQSDFLFFFCYEGYQSGLRVGGELRSDVFYFQKDLAFRLTFVKKTTNRAYE